MNVLKMISVFFLFWLRAVASSMNRVHETISVKPVPRFLELSTQGVQWKAASFASSSASV